MMKVLIIEDDKIFGEMLSLYLSGENFEVKHVETARDGLAAVTSYQPEVILLDLVLPDGDGADLCVHIRSITQAPIIVVSMKSNVSEKIKVLTAGADDYMCKPFSMQELKARIETIWRRFQATPVVQTDLQQVPEAPLERIQVDHERRTIVIDGQHQETTYSGFEIMRMFCQNPSRVFSREELINSLRGVDSYINDRAIDVHVTNLRKKIEVNPKEPKHIKTVWGVGYKFIP
ncbi:response regulator transcription factor [Paenibacillus tarimensis]|uniref:response regulator transcription factor n=1 Tax=Paenibacillus tarimensis TaxID=416012 RepID=UPI001F329822|nr:response regulator transcription factor [Paenibacillus tarimensis]MCF2943845.1 response regulator transcription factor [Paenibacillus tarimensis]